MKLPGKRQQLQEPAIYKAAEGPFSSFRPPASGVSDEVKEKAEEH